jgi:ribosomal RNA-processing protein 7
MDQSQQTSHHSSFITIPISLPPVPSFPRPATHYLYIRGDAPKIPTPDTPRSLFLSNVPVDASETALRALFKQLDGALVERVEFEDDPPRKGSQAILVKGQSWDDGAVQEKKLSGKKRKRAEVEENLAEEYALPPTWSLGTKKSGSSAVIVFVDKTTADAVLKECRRLVKKGRKLEWVQTEELGVKSWFPGKMAYVC